MNPNKKIMIQFGIMLYNHGNPKHREREIKIYPQIKIKKESFALSERFVEHLLQFFMVFSTKYYNFLT